MYKLIVIVCLILLCTLPGCVEAINQSSAPTQTENAILNAEVVPNNALNTISEDIIFLYDLAVDHSIQLKSIDHNGETLIVELSINDSLQYMDFLNALNDSEHYFPNAIPPSISAGINEARLIFLSNVVPDIEKVLGLDDRPSECYSTAWYDNPNATLMELTNKKNLIVNNPIYIGLFATNISPRIIEQNEYVIISYEFSLVNGEIDKILAFISDLDTVSAPIILKKTVITENIDENGEPELKVDIGLDYYAYCGGR